MLAKNRNLSIKTIALILMVLILAFFTLGTKVLKIERMDLMQYLMSLNLGFSNRINLVDEGKGFFFYGTPEGQIQYKRMAWLETINAIPRIIKYKVAGDNFKRLDIDIKFLDFQKINLDKINAGKIGLLVNPITVNAIIRFEGNTYKSDLRLKGDMGTHWLGKYRNSFRINLKNNETILGNSKFSLQKPIERSFPYDYVFQKLMRDAGNLSSSHNFVHVYVNGTDWGIMNMEEHLSKEFLEKQNKKDSVIIRFSPRYEESLLFSYPAYRIWSGNYESDSSLYVRFYGSKDYLKDYQYREIYSYILKQHKENNLQLYDIDSFTKAYIMALAWGNFHTLTDNNSRYYFNPYILKLEPITTDAVSWRHLNDNLESIEFFPIAMTNQLKRVLSSQTYSIRLNKNLSNVRDIIFDNAQPYFDNASLIFPVDKKKSTKIIKNNMKKIISNKENYLQLNKDAVILNSEHERVTVSFKNGINYIDPKGAELPTNQQASEFGEHLHIRHYTDGTIEFYNLIPDDVIVKDIVFDGKSVIENEITIPSYLSDIDPTIIKTPYKGIQDKMFTVNTEYQGYSRDVKNNITLISDEIVNPLLLNTADEFDFIHKLNDKTYEIKSGNWTVNNPIIIKGDLHIYPGVNLKFSKDAYLIVEGSLTAIGGEANIITFKAMSDSWKGIYVLNANNKSHLKNVSISNITALEDGLLSLTGGVTFYKSDVDFENVKISDIKAEDVINIVESNFSLKSVFINNTNSDGIDSDFSKGEVLDSEFLNIGGDALDFSGSDVSIKQIKASNVKDKAVSAGEKSTLNVENSNFNNIGVGVASKDGSTVVVSNTNISNYKLYAAMSYIKKNFYDKPNIILNNCSVSNGEPYIRQKGTNMTVDGVDIPEVYLNVEKLYETGAMMK